MTWQDDPTMMSAAWEGIASNLAVPMNDRLAAAQQALSIVHKRIEELEQQNYWLTRERDSARDAAQPLADANQMWHERIRKVREIAKRAKATWANHCICPGEAEEHDAGCLGVQAVGWTLDPQEILAVLNGEGETCDPGCDLRPGHTGNCSIPLKAKQEIGGES